MRTLLRAICVCAVLVGSIAHGDTVDFEDVAPFVVPATPFDSGGLTFTSDGAANGVFGGVLPGANNGTQVFAWCGSNCGGEQLVDVAATSGGLFNLESIDAGNFMPFGAPNGWVADMTVELIGYRDNGSTVSQSLAIQEDVFTTYDLIGFTNLTRFEIFAPSVFPSFNSRFVGVEAFPDPVIDNIVFNTDTVPEPGTAGFLAVGMLAMVRRRR